MESMSRLFHLTNAHISHLLTISVVISPMYVYEVD